MKVYFCIGKAFWNIKKKDLLFLARLEMLVMKAIAVLDVLYRRNSTRTYLVQGPISTHDNTRLLRGSVFPQANVLYE